MVRVGRRRAPAAADSPAPTTVPVALSTASVYPESCAAAFDIAARLGYDGVEVMVWTDPVTQEAGALARLAEHHGIPITSIHAPTLLLTQRVWGTDPWDKIDRSIDVAREVGASTVVLHPPFRWQREYAAGFADGVAMREADSGITLAVENMYPWRARNREIEAYLPHWDPVGQPYEHVTLDLSHTATAGSDALAGAGGDLHDAGRVPLVDLLGRQPLRRRRLEGDIAEPGPLGEGRNLLNRGVVPQLPEERRTSERQGTARERNNEQLNEPHRVPSHAPVITAACSKTSIKD